MKKLLLLPILCIFSLKGMELDSSSAHAVKVLQSRGNLYVEDENAAYRVEGHRMSQDLRRMLAAKVLGKFNTAGYIRVTKDSEGKYLLAAKVRGLGGGIGGTWLGCVAGKFAVHFVAQVGIGIATAGVAIVCPPAALPFAYAAEAAVAPTVEAVSNVVAIGTGILGGVATGPV